MSKSADEIAKKYGGVATSPDTTSPAAPDATSATSAALDPDEIAKKYGGSTVSHGASGSWETPSAIEKFQTDHPILSFPLTAIPRFGRAAVEGVEGGANMIKDAFTTPTQPGEEGLDGHPIPRALKRLIVDPSVNEAKQAIEERRKAGPGGSFKAFAHGVAAIPIVGPLGAGLVRTARDQGIPEALGLGASMYLTGQLLDQIPEVKSTPVERAMNERQIAAFASRIKSGVGEESVHSVAETAIPVFQKAAAELGTALEQPLDQAFPSRSYGSEASKKNVRTAGEHALEIADHAVGISDRPFTEVLRQHGAASTNRAQFGEVPTPQIQQSIMQDLEKLASENDHINQPLADAIRAAATRVNERGGTFNGLNELKVLANKKSAPIFDKSLGGQLNASADAAYAWKALGDVTRAHMYPELSKLSGIDLRAAGAREAAVMDARDGLRQNYYKEVLPAHAQRMALNYFEYLRNGSFYHHNFISRALGLKETPAGEFNTMFKRGLGEVPPMPDQVPFYPGAAPTPGTVAGTQQDLLPTGAPDSEPLLAPPPGTANTRNGPGGSTMAEDIFRVQQRADRAARSAPPPEIDGPQLFMPGANEAKPNEPFYPGRTGVHTKPVLDEKGKPVLDADGKPTEIVRDYTNQHQLFSHYQTPYKWEPSKLHVSSTQELQTVAREIEHYLGTQIPPPTIRAQWEADLKSLRDEIYRRQEALRTPGKKNTTP